jgi:hypothetical protein
MVRIYVQYILTIVLLTGLCSCANIMSPTGGPTDKQAPTITKRSQPDSVLNYKGGKATWDFDERIDVAAIKVETFPLLRDNPKIAATKNGFSITIPDTLLEPNTTYKISFGNTIKDINEGNAMPNLSYTFSTGNVLDTLMLTGKVMQAQFALPDTAAKVLLYASIKNDSDVCVQKPLYATRLQADGSFTISNLPAKEFYIYAVADKNNNYIFDNTNERIAYFNSTVIPSGKGLPAIQLYTFTDSIKSTSTSDNKVANKQRGSRTRCTINIDTTKPTQRSFDITQAITITFANALSNWQLNKIRLYQDAVLDETGILSYDSTKHEIKLNSDFAKDAQYTLVLLDSFATDTAMCKGDTLRFRTKKDADYGTLKINYNKPLAEYLQFIELHSEGKVLSKQQLKLGTIKYNLLNPGNYKLLLLHDRNSNQVWDNGSYRNGKVQPEYYEVLEANITIKANWENTIDITNENKK